MPLYIGLMSGTSMDAIDVAIIDVNNEKVELIDFLEYPIPDDIISSLKEINGTSQLQLIAKLDQQLGSLFGEASNKILSKNNIPAESIIAIGSHGQTVYHAPNDVCPSTIQIADPNIIAVNTNITTVADFRRKDIALGGQGAPLAPIFHLHQFSSDKPSVVLNIGGFANITVFDDTTNDSIIGFDTGPGNVLLDDWIKLKKGLNYDAKGAWAASGRIVQTLLDKCLKDNYFELKPPKSTGRDDFNLAWLEAFLTKNLQPEDVQATLLALTVETIGSAIETYAPNTLDIIVCGGGALNDFLMESLQKRLIEQKVMNSEVFGINPLAVEACCFAWLAHLTISNQSGNITAVTNAKRPAVLGGIYSAK